MSDEQNHPGLSDAAREELRRFAAEATQAIGADLLTVRLTENSLAAGLGRTFGVLQSVINAIEGEELVLDADSFSRMDAEAKQFDALMEKSDKARFPAVIRDLRRGMMRVRISRFALGEFVQFLGQGTK